MIPSLKKIFIILFTKNPYKIQRFAELYQKAIGECLDQPESYTGVINIQKGQPFSYTLSLNSAQKQVNHRYLKNKRRYKSTGILKEPDRYLYSVSNGGILGQLGLVYDSSKRSFIDESAKEWTINLKDSVYTNIYHLPEPKYLDGLTLSFLTTGADGGFYHFLFESLIKLGMFAPYLQEAKYLIFNGPKTEWKLKWISRANVDPDKIIWMDNQGHYECSQLLFTNRLIGDQQISPWCLDTLKKSLNIPACNKPAKKKVVWITRKSAASRAMTWEDELLNEFPEIKNIDLAHLNVEETITVMQTATHIIAPHGAGLANLFLCNPEVHVLELFQHTATFQPYYYRIADQLKLQYQTVSINFADAKDNHYGLAFFTPVLRNFIQQSY